MNVQKFMNIRVYSINRKYIKKGMKTSICMYDVCGGMTHICMTHIGRVAPVHTHMSYTLNVRKHKPEIDGRPSNLCIRMSHDDVMRMSQLRRSVHLRVNLFVDWTFANKFERLLAVGRVSADLSQHLNNTISCLIPQKISLTY